MQFEVLSREAGRDRPLGDARRRASGRPGFTLIELLVVISILMLLAAMAIPAVRPALEGRRIRESARAINVYLGAAQGEAMRTGRPCGVILQRVEGLPQCSMVLHQAIVPPPYAGDEIGSAVQLSRPRPRVIRAQLVGSFNPRLVHVDDRMQINAQGPWYRILGPDVDRDGVIDNSAGEGGAPLRMACDQDNVPWARTPSAPLPYRILRRPIKSSAKALQLPAGAVVDLTASGTGNNAGDPSIPADLGNIRPLGWVDSVNQYPVMIMFSPNGSIEKMLYVEYDPISGTYAPVSDLITAPILLLVGKRERVIGQPITSATAEEDWPNWTDQTNLWVTINPQTGLVSTAENFYVDPAAIKSIDWTNRTIVWQHILAAQTFARESKSMGGR